MLTNDEIIRKFVNGAISGHSNSMMISGDSLIGYKWAVYGKRVGNKIIVYTGWRGYSTTTSKHINNLKQYADVISKERPSL